MRKFEIKDAAIMEIAVQQEIQRSEASRYDHRLHGILLICKGFSCAEVADFFNHSPRTIQYWAKRFEEEGFAGLVDMPHSGRPKRWDEKIMEEIGRDLRESPRFFEYPQNLWDGKLLSHHLSEKYNVFLGVRQCQRLFTHLGFRRRKPRPVIAKSDPEAKATYKKTPGIGDDR
jgi:transposase